MTRVLVTGGTGELGRRVSLPAHKRNLEPLHVQNGYGKCMKYLQKIQ
jgi:hypothetical protein